jgi:hypothetical protein
MKERFWLATAILYLSVVLSVFITVVMVTGMVAFFAKTFFHIQPKWLFGLFD